MVIAHPVRMKSEVEDNGGVFREELLYKRDFEFRE